MAATKIQLANLSKARAVRAANLKNGKKKTTKKVVKKAAVKKITVKTATKKTVKTKKNPTTTVIHYTVKVTTFTKKVGYLKKSGGFDTELRAAFLMNKLNAEKRAREVFATHPDYLHKVEVVDVKKSDEAYRKNPVPASKMLKVKEASALFEDFTGHEADHYTKRELNLPDVALQFGLCDGIMYETVRDNVVEHYIHKFKKSARPLIAASHDGKSLHLVGGNYRFTNRGIVDH
jgi:hypothetical protein